MVAPAALLLLTCFVRVSRRVSCVSAAAQAFREKRDVWHDSGNLLRVNAPNRFARVPVFVSLACIANLVSHTPDIGPTDSVGIARQWPRD